MVSAINYFGKCGKATTYYYMKELNDEPSFTNFPLIVEDLVVMKGKDRCIRKVKILALIVMKLDFIVWYCAIGSYPFKMWLVRKVFIR